MLQALAQLPANRTLLIDYLPALRLQVDVIGGGMNATPQLGPDEISHLIPHSGAMCMLSHLDRWDLQHIVCCANNHRDGRAHRCAPRSGLLSSALIEYAAQAMALHGALVGQAQGKAVRPGYLASVRSTRMHVLTLHDLPAAPTDKLRIEATQQAGDERQLLYAICREPRRPATGRGARRRGAQHTRSETHEHHLPQARAGHRRQWSHRRAPLPFNWRGTAPQGAGALPTGTCRPRRRWPTTSSPPVGLAEACAFDLTDRAATHAACESLLAQGPVQILVNNAGKHDDAVFPAMRQEQWDEVIDVSLNGFFNVTQPLMMPMIRTRWGRVINISSVAAITGNRGQVNYAAAKGALNSATKALALEVASRGITVNAVAPGIIDSGMAELVFDKAMIERMVPMKRAGTTAEVAALVGFLASEHAGYISGQVISINGGMI